MVSVQMLTELEEVIQYKLMDERREVIRQMWWERLQVRDFSVAFIFRLQWRFSTSGGVFNFIAGLPTSGRRLAKDNSSSFLGHNSTARHEDLVEVCQPVSQERTACLVSQDVDYAARHQPQIASQ